MPEQPEQPTPAPTRVRRQSVRTVVAQPPPQAANQGSQVQPDERQAIDDQPGNVAQQIAPDTSRRAGELPNINDQAQGTEKQEIKRAKLGYAIRTDLVKECARIALDHDKHRYEVIEDALERYIEEYHKSR